MSADTIAPPLLSVVALLLLAASLPRLTTDRDPLGPAGWLDVVAGVAAVGAAVAWGWARV